MNIIDKTLYYNIFFYLGSLVGVMKNYPSISNMIRMHKVLSLICAAMIMLLGSYLVEHNQPSNVFVLHYIFPLVSIPCVWISALVMEDNKLLSYFGRYSLQFYLNHLLIIVISFYLAAYVYRIVNSYTLCYMLIVVTTIIISAMMLYAEKKLKRLLKIFGL